MAGPNLTQEELSAAQASGIDNPVPVVPVEDLAGGGLKTTAEQAQAQDVAVIDAEVRGQERPVLEALGAAAGDTPTAWIGRKIYEQMDGMHFDYDPTFKLTTADMDEVFARYGLEETDEMLALLASAGSKAELYDTAHSASKAQERQRVVSEHGFLAFATGMADPVQLVADMATFGTTRALKLGRVATAVVGAAGATAPTALADLAGRETSATEYAITAALAGGAFSLFGGEAANRIARGEANWYGRVTPRGERSERGFVDTVNEFTTEHDRLVMYGSEGAPIRERLMAQLGDDPLRRAETLNNNNAPSFMRMFHNELDGLNKTFQDGVERMLKETGGFGFLSRKMDPSGNYTQARLELERTVADEILKRDEFYRQFGHTNGMPRGDARIARLADDYEVLMNRAGELARDAGVRGFDDFTPRAGYFHRAWNAAAIMRHPEVVVMRALTASARSGVAGLDHETATLIARSIYDRAKAKLRDEGVEFFGTIGKTDTELLRDMLTSAGTLSEARIASIMGRIERNQTGRSTVKYGKGRLPLDMTASATALDGTVVRMADLIDTDLMRLAENYTGAMSGRSALAKAGVGVDDASIAAFRREYVDSLASLPAQVRKDRIEIFDGLLSDYTGMRPTANILGQGMQRVKSIADSTMLSASGLWQAAEYATMAHRYGFVTANVEFLRQFPGVATILRRAGREPDLRDELEAVLNLDLARDIRLRPWTRQHDVNLASSDTTFDRLLHAGKQAVPYLNAMKFVHKHQARMNANLSLNKVARAAAGDAKAERMVAEYGLKGPEWDRVKSVLLDKATYKGKNAKQMNWDSWDQADIDSVMNVALRMMDDAILFGRAGQGVGSQMMSRTAVGQVFGQFRSFVGYAHNKLLRGTLENGGVGGLATLLAFQYPLTGLMVGVNEARKGNLDLSEDGLKTIAKKTIGYTAGLGLAADAAGIVGWTGGRGGLGIPITGVFDAGRYAATGGTKLLTGEVRSGAADIAKAAKTAVPAIGLLPGTDLAIKALRGD